jgi:hypothetical protein
MEMHSSLVDVPFVVLSESLESLSEEEAARLKKPLVEREVRLCSSEFFGLRGKGKARHSPVRQRHSHHVDPLFSTVVERRLAVLSAENP